jgi:peptidylprolyl isomerase
MKKVKNNLPLIVLGTIVLILVIALMIYFLRDSGDSNKMKVKIETNHGDILIELYGDMPITVGNFKNLVEQGVYDGVIFHRIIDGFMIQGGDPTGTGDGDPAIPKIQDEFTHAEGNKNNRGTISMANAGPNTGSSQFFINLVGNNFLDGKHPTFGEVVEGMDIIDKIAKVQTGANDKPLQDVIMLKVTLV